VIRRGRRTFPRSLCARSTKIASIGAFLPEDEADLPWSRVAALLVINRLCDPGSELAIEQRWFNRHSDGRSAGDGGGKVNDTRLYRCLYRLLPIKASWSSVSGSAMGSCSLRSSMFCSMT
jgi:hypothetical protein